MDARHPWWAIKHKVEHTKINIQVHNTSEHATSEGECTKVWQLITAKRENVIVKSPFHLKQKLKLLENKPTMNIKLNTPFHVQPHGNTCAQTNIPTTTKPYKWILPNWWGKQGSTYDFQKPKLWYRVKWPFLSKCWTCYREGQKLYIKLNNN